MSGNERENGSAADTARREQKLSERRHRHSRKTKKPVWDETKVKSKSEMSSTVRDSHGYLVVWSSHSTSV